MDEIKLPCKIGDTMFIVEDFNQYYDKTKPYQTKFGSKIMIKKIVVESFIIDENGVFIAESSHDGYNKISTYHNLTLEKYGDCKIFREYKNALEFVRSVC